MLYIFFFDKLSLCKIIIIYFWHLRYFNVFNNDLKVIKCVILIVKLYININTFTVSYLNNKPGIQWKHIMTWNLYK